jgi:hypothetical protein
MYRDGTIDERDDEKERERRKKKNRSLSPSLVSFVLKQTTEK